MAQHATTPSLGMQDFFSTTLNGAVNPGDTVINLNAVPTATEGFLVIDPNNTSTREIIYYNSKTSGSVTCPDATQGSSRGLGGTTVQAHVSSTLVEMRGVAEYWNALQNGQSLSMSAILGVVYPVGAIYMSVVSTNPATALGFGTWSAWGSGQVPIGVNTGDSSFNTVEKTGGAKDHQHKTPILANNNVGGAPTTLPWNTSGYGVGSATSTWPNYGQITGIGSSSTGYPYLTSGTYTADSALPPYITCYMFKRTA